MSLSERKLPVLALSACSIPVMLAFAGFGTRAAGLHSPAVFGENVDFDLAQDQRSYNPISSILNAGVICNTPEGASPASDNRELLAQSDSSWICVAPDGDHFWVADGKGSSIATYRFVEASDSDGQVSFELVAILDAIGSDDSVADKTDKVASGWVELQLSEDGQWLYQLFEHTGAMAVYEVDGNTLTLVELLTA